MEMKEYIREYTLKDIVRMRNPSVVVIGGGTGLGAILRGLKKFTPKLTAVVTMGDDGGSSGRLRDDLGLQPPGDVRNCILALADDENIMQRLFNYRFDSGELTGHNFGNLFLAAMNGISHDFHDAIQRTSDVLHITGRVLPVTMDTMTLQAELGDGTCVEGESIIPKEALAHKSPIKRLSLKETSIEPFSETIDAIRSANIIVLGPGSLYTSLICNLLVPGIAQAILESTAKTYYMGNLMTQPGETDGYTQDDHIEAICRHLNCTQLFSAVIQHNGVIPQDVWRFYKDNGQLPVLPTEKRSDMQIITDDFVSIEDGRIRHNTDLAAKRLFEHYLGRST